MGDPVPSSAISDATTGGLSVIVITGGSTGNVLTLQANGTYAPAAPSSGGVSALGTTGTDLNISGSTLNVPDASATARGVVTTGAQTLAGTKTFSKILCAPGPGAYTQTIGWTNGVGFEVWSTNHLIMLLGGEYMAAFISGAAANPGLRLGQNKLLSWSSNGNDATSSATASIGQSGGTVTVTTNLTSTAITATGLMCCGVYTFATVPSASSNTGKFLRISDRAQKHAYSDGTNWRFFGDDAIIS